MHGCACDIHIYMQTNTHTHKIKVNHPFKKLFKTAFTFRRLHQSLITFSITKQKLFFVVGFIELHIRHMQIKLRHLVLPDTVKDKAPLKHFYTHS